MSSQHSLMVVKSFYIPIFVFIEKKNCPHQNCHRLRCVPFSGKHNSLQHRWRWSFSKSKRKNSRNILELIPVRTNKNPQEQNHQPLALWFPKAVIRALRLRCAAAASASRCRSPCSASCRASAVAASLHSDSRPRGPRRFSWAPVMVEGIRTSPETMGCCGGLGMSTPQPKKGEKDEAVFLPSKPSP